MDYDEQYKLNMRILTYQISSNVLKNLAIELEGCKTLEDVKEKFNKVAKNYEDMIKETEKKLKQ
jgi:hypothetical protein